MRMAGERISSEPELPPASGEPAQARDERLAGVIAADEQVLGDSGSSRGTQALSPRLAELRRGELDEVIEPSVDSLPLYLRSVRPVGPLTAEAVALLAKRIARVENAARQ